MAKSRRRKPNMAVKMMFIGSIVALSMMGVGYSYWNTNLNIGALVQTGELDVQFGTDSSYELVNGSGELYVSFQDPRTISIEGTVEEAMTENMEETDKAFIYSPEYSDYEGRILVNIVNKGRIPAEFQENDVDADDNVIAGTIEQNKLLNPEGESSDTALNQEYVVAAGAEEGSKTVDFTGSLFFHQPD